MVNGKLIKLEQKYLLPVRKCCCRNLLRVDSLSHVTVVQVPVVDIVVEVVLELEDDTVAMTTALSLYEMENGCNSYQSKNLKR